MIRTARISILLLFFACLGLVPPAYSQATPPTAAQSAASDKSGAYYNFAMGHLYAELAMSYGNRSDYATKAIEYYKQALKLDPSATFLSEELTELYVQSGQLSRAVTEAEELLKQNPDNLDARRVLGRIYARLIGDSQQNKIDENMLKKAIDQYQKITEKDPSDLDSLLVLGRLQRVAHNSPDAEKAFKAVLAKEADNEEALTGLAMVYSGLGDTKNATEMLRRATEKNPNDRTLAALAGFYEQTHDYPNAVDALKRAIAVSQDPGRLKRALAQDLAFEDKLDEALAVYKEVSAEDPRDASVQLRLAEIYRQKKDFENARAALAKARQMDNANLDARFEEANLLEAEGKPDQSIAALKALLAETAKKQYSDADKGVRITLLERLANVYRNNSKYPQAIEALRQIGELDPEVAPRVAVQVIETHRVAKDMSAARQEADAALKKFPKDRAVVLEHASLLAELGKVDQAVAELRGTMNAEKDRETLLAIAQIYEKGKRFNDEQKVLDQAEKISTTPPDKTAVQFARGAMFERMKNFEGAEAEFRKVLRAEPDNAGALNYLGYMFADRDMRLDEAQKLISRALELDPGNGAYLDSLGWVYFRQNQLDRAEDNLRRALEKIGKDPTVHDHLGDVYFKEGKIREAILQWEASLKEWDSSTASDLDSTELAKINKKLESARVRMAKESQPNK